jgi:adenine-specific DNA methylase
LLERLGGRLEPVIKRKKLPSGRIEEVKSEQTVGGILHWGRESGAGLEWFREQVKKAYGAKAPRVLDPFSGGGAIPLEAMRVGAEVTALDLNPVAWFLLKCTLEYPQKLAGQKRRLPDFALGDRPFMESYLEAQGLKGALLRTRLERMGLGEDREPQLAGFEGGDALLEADIAWHVRAWGRRVLRQARIELAHLYPTYAEFEPLGDHLLDWRKKRKESRLELIQVNAEGVADVAPLNAEFGVDYLADARNPRWIPKPTVAYLWARTVQCKNCRAVIPLLKTRWLCKKDKKRVVLTMAPNPSGDGVVFGVESEVPSQGANAAARREHDKRLGAGTMSRSGATCPCCNTIMSSEDIRLEARAGRLGQVLTSAVVDGQFGKEYRVPTELEISLDRAARAKLDQYVNRLPFGPLKEPIPQGGSRAGGGSPFTVHIYGMTEWRHLFTPRQLLALSVFTLATRSIRPLPGEDLWGEAICAYVSLATSRLADRLSTICHWSVGFEKIQNTFSRFALSMSWDFSEGNPLSTSSGTYDGQVDWIAEVIEHCIEATAKAPAVVVRRQSATTQLAASTWDVIVTDPPYYDAIPYSDLMDFFYVWQRRLVYDLSEETRVAFQDELGPKWSHDAADGELIDDASRFGGNRLKSKDTYEEGMFKAFQRFHTALMERGRLVLVFAHKHPDAWETLVSAIIRAGFVVDGSWPIQTEMGNRTRAIAGAALSSSVWLVCKKRLDTARPGWDNLVLEEMRTNITQKLRDFWDAGIRGPDFVWAATGPALEAYSEHPVVKKANDPGQLLTVSEFLRNVRRIVVDFVVGRVVLGDDSGEQSSGLDDVTTYYLLHRHDFGVGEAPAGACILYALSCGLSDRDLTDQYELLVRTGGRDLVEEEEAGGEAESADEVEGSGNKVKLRDWGQRKGRSLGYDNASGRPAPLIDQVHRLMHLWKSGDVVKVNEYVDARALRQNKLFHHLLQALIELALPASEERALLEKLSSHVAARGVAPVDQLL